MASHRNENKTALNSGHLTSVFTNNGNRTEWSPCNSACNHTSDKKIGRPRSGSPICLSRLITDRI